jgi:uncharacterized membrane protein
MPAQLRKFLTDLAESFWVLPALLAAAGVLAAFGLVELDRGSTLPHWLRQDWLYDGGPTGARTLLGAIASSTIGVAGTAFSITIAALSLAAGQMGPRLLRNFTRDRGNQVTLGVLLGTFCYALMVLRSVRTPNEGAFVPHLALTFGIGLAFTCVGVLIYFVGHMAGRINVDTVLDLVSDDLHEAIERLTSAEPQPPRPSDDLWNDSTPICDTRSGYLQHLDEDALADWAAEHNARIRLLLRPGDYVFPGNPVAEISRAVEGADVAIQNATALGSQRVSASDLRYAVRQLVEVAVRALSPGINDPHTAISVLDRLGAALCKLQPRHLRTGVSFRQQRLVLLVPHETYDQLLNTMFHSIRQSAAGNPTVLLRQLEVLGHVMTTEREIERLTHLRRHADLVLEDARRTIGNANDLLDVERRYQALAAIYDSRQTAPAQPPPIRRLSGTAHGV